jgi:hypothetical protein
MGGGPRLAAAMGVATAIAGWAACINDFGALDPAAAAGATGGEAVAGPGNGGGGPASSGAAGASAAGGGGAGGAGMGGCGAGTEECDGSEAGCESLESIHHCGACDNDCSMGYPSGWHCIASVGCGCQDDADCKADTAAEAICDQATGVCTCDTKRCDPGEACGLVDDTIACLCGAEECRGGFACDTDLCACTSDGSCGFGGTCMRGRCICDGQTCAPNRKCVMDSGVVCEES